MTPIIIDDTFGYEAPPVYIQTSALPYARNGTA